MLGLSVLGLISCGGRAPAQTTPPVTPSPVTQSHAGEDRPLGPMTISRPQLLAVLDGGFGRFLQGIETQAALEGGAFTGFRVTSFAPIWLADRRGVRAALRPTDIITRVNDLPIERPEQAFVAFESLREAEALVISMKRDGVEETLRIPIIDDQVSDELEE